MLSGLSELASKLGSTLTEQTTESYTGKGATEIANAYKSHAQVMQQLLSVLVGKQGLLAYFFLSDPMSQVLRQLEAAEDVSNPSPGSCRNATDWAYLAPQPRGHR